MDWKECSRKRIIKNVNPDKNMIKSLIRTSENKLKSESELKMNNITASSKITLAYDSLRGLLEALALKNNYKIYNHECYTAFLKEVMKENSKGDEFDRIRKFRNRINYYGENISSEKAEEIITDIKNLIKSILKMLK